MNKIKNFAALIGNGFEQPVCFRRKLLLGAMEAALAKVDPHKLIADNLHLHQGILNISGLEYDLSSIGRIFVIGAGKASGLMAEALEAILEARIEQGFINVPHGSVAHTRIIKTNSAGHPQPDQAGMDGAAQMLQIAEKATTDDLVICLISGGGSSLMPLPARGISLAEKRQLTGDLLKSGASITEMNIVRKHLSAIKGGQLARACFPAQVVNLILSDVIGNGLDVIASGPTVADPSTFADARSVLERYRLWSSAPAAIKKLIELAITGAMPETPKPEAAFFGRVKNIIIGENRTALNAAAHFLDEAGVKTLMLPHAIECPSIVAADLLSEQLNNLHQQIHTTNQPRAIIAGGETTVEVTSNGRGGRTQHLALAVATKLKATAAAADSCFAAMATDGIDGPTDAAGAMVDASTLLRARLAAANPDEYLKNHDSNSFFAQTQDLIITGYTGTNVNDLFIWLIT